MFRALVAVALLAVARGLRIVDHERAESASDVHGQVADDALLDAWKALPGRELDPWKAARDAALSLSLPSRPIALKDYPIKTKTYYMEDESEITVTYHAAQRLPSLAQGRIFEHVFAEAVTPEGEKARSSPSANQFDSIEDIVTYVRAHHPNEDRPAFVWLLSRERFSMGRAEDMLEFGIGHLNLIEHQSEIVHFAGEVSVDLKEGLVYFNFMSGMFTLPMLQEFKATTGQEFGDLENMWKGLFEELYKWSGKKGVWAEQDAQIPEVEPPHSIDEVISESTGTRVFRNHPFCTGPLWMRQCVCHETKEGPFKGFSLNYCLPPRLISNGNYTDCGDGQRCAMAYTNCDASLCMPDTVPLSLGEPAEVVFEPDSVVGGYFPEIGVFDKSS